MQTQHKNLVGFIWNITNKLRGPYRPPQYCHLLLPLIVLRRFDLVLAEDKQQVLDEKKQKALSRFAVNGRKQELFNTTALSLKNCWVIQNALIEAASQHSRSGRWQALRVNEDSIARSSHA